MDKLHFKDDFETQNIRVVRHCINSFGVNTYFLISKHTRDAAVIDPGGVAETLLAALKDEGAKVRRILFTHAHIDHIYAADELKKALPEALVTYHIKEQPVIESLPDMCRMFGVACRAMPSMDRDLDKEPEFSVGDLQIRSILTPGHTPGGVCYYIPEEKLCFTGDTLFKGSVGRTDFEGGSGFDLRQSVLRLIDVLPDDVQILPGHGKYTTMGNEKENNFYLKVDKWR
ncbi:MAG: MBL fold metallo-hydrolase [Proteobacteria bacterium]|nr:MBL fold metallo-hydrolase [Pseudomonadota bacterium]MBQ4360825.1 MBL fold metallo-hydrolase [Pseudomonadota bacterium]